MRGSSKEFGHVQRTRQRSTCLPELERRLVWLKTQKRMAYRDHIRRKKRLGRDRFRLLKDMAWKQHVCVVERDRVIYALGWQGVWTGHGHR